MISNNEIHTLSSVRKGMDKIIMLSRKYLVLTGIIFIILLLLIIESISWNNNKAIDNLNSTDIKEKIEAENSVYNKSKVESSKTLQEESTSDKDSTNNQSLINEDIETEIYKLIGKYYDDKIDKDILTIDEQSETEQTLESIIKKREIIEKYSNLNTYVKPGLDIDTYVVFSTYDIKLKNINTLVPGMSVLSVIKDETGILLINNDSNDDKLNEYINQMTNAEDIKNIIEEVNSKLADVIKKDNSLKDFIDYIKDIT